MAEAEAHLGRHATDASHRRARLVRAYRLLRRDLVGKDEADVRHRRTPMTMGAAGGSMNPELIFEIATPLGFIVPLHARILGVHRDPEAPCSHR